MPACKNCAPNCKATLRLMPGNNRSIYHVAPEVQQAGFPGQKTSVTPMGSICPCCGCKDPAIL